MLKVYPDLGLEVERQVAAGRAEDPEPWEEFGCSFFQPEASEAPAKKKRKKLLRRTAFAYFRTLDSVLNFALGHGWEAYLGTAPSTALTSRPTLVLHTDEGSPGVAGVAPVNDLPSSIPFESLCV